MSDCILAIDAGGTSLKYSLKTEDGSHATGGVNAQTPIEREGRPQLLAAFTQTAESAKRWAEARGHTITRVGVCCPGPFDFVRGMSRMTHKWQDAYEKPIAPALWAVLGDLPVFFLHDASAFMLGEGLIGAGRDTERVAGVMLGTGFGFGYMIGGRVQINRHRGPRISIWNTPFGDGIVEDYVSRRAIRARFAALGGDPSADVRDIAEAARASDGNARKTFALTGELLGEILAPVLASLGCTRLIVGGQIARSAALFLPYVSVAGTVCVAAHLEDAAMRGMTLYCALGHSATMEEG